MHEEPEWYAKKPYIHFDLPLGAKEAANYVCDPKKVSRHPFYPLLAYELITTRKSKSPPGSGMPFVREEKSRPIAYPAHKDGYIFSYYKSILEARYEKWLNASGLNESVTAFRKTRENNITLAKRAFDFIAANPDCRIVVTDVESFFDNLDHRILKEIWCAFLGQPSLPEDHFAVYRAITRFSTVKKHKVYNLFRIRLAGRTIGRKGPRRICLPSEFREKVVERGLIEPSPAVGIPQGTSLSPLLSNMYMASLDLAMHKWATGLNGKYWRYCDDILIVIPGQGQIDARKVLDAELARLNLSRSDKKTNELTGADLHSRKQLQYLGFLFNGREALVRPSSVHRYHRKLKKGIRWARVRQRQESERGSPDAPFRKQALYNMFSEKPKWGKRIRSIDRKRKYTGNFTHYMKRAAAGMESRRIVRQRFRLLERFRNRVNSAGE